MPLNRQAQAKNFVRQALTWHPRYNEKGTRLAFYEITVKMFFIGSKWTTEVDV
jgi:hypothetical protein